ncbi:MAG: THUMP domain-containing protein [Thermodesulfovibrionales bacterium]
MNFSREGKIFLSCGRGLQPFLAAELQKLGFPVDREAFSGVASHAALSDTMRMNLFLRTASRVLFQLEEFRASDPKALYLRLVDLAWEDWISEDGHVSVTSSTDTPEIRDTRYANQKCKDAIVDRIRRKTGRRPDAGPERDRAVVHLFWKGDHCSVFFDTSGEPLAKRGYRRIPFLAPLSETTVAAAIMAAGWKDTGHFVNPMCGSGTFAIEAALTGLDRPAGILRDNFGFMHLKGFDRRAWSSLRESARKMARPGLSHRIIATDIDPQAVEAARKNAMTAGVDHLIDFSVCDFASTPVPEGGGVVMLNPEYGGRLGREADLEAVYRRIGDFFKQRCSGYRGYVFTGNLALAKKVGLRTSRRLTFYNSTIECRLLEYELYRGSAKERGAVGT